MQRQTLAALLVAVLVAAVAVLGATAGLGTVGAQSQTDDIDRTITVAASGQAEAAPDEAVVSVRVVSEGDDPAAIREDLATDADRLRETLDELGVEYETSSYGIEQPPRHAREEVDAAYVGHHEFEVTADDPDAAGDIVQAAADVGAEVDGVELTLAEETRTELRDEAIEDAMDDARHQADTVAGSADLQVTQAATIDASQRNYRPVSLDYATEDADASAPRTVIDAGDVSVSYDVQVTYNATAA